MNLPTRREHLPPIVNLKKGPLDVRFTGEPFKVLVHWLPDAGRRGSTMPCLGADCAIHHTGRPRPIMLVAGVVRPKEAGPRVTEDEMTRQKVANFRQLPAEIRERLLQEARRLPAMQGEGSHAAVSLLEPLAANIMWPEKQPAVGVLEWETVMVDLPFGAGRACGEQIGDRPWRGHHALFLRAHVGAETSVRLLGRPALAGAVNLPEPFSVPHRAAQHWGFPTDCVRAELDEDGYMVLTFSLRSQVGPTVPYPRIAEGA